MFDTYAEIFAERAQSYHEAMEAFPRARDAEFRCVLEPLDEAPHRILCNLPAGGGYLAHHLRPGFTYIGVDPSSDFVEVGSKGAARMIRAELTDVPLESGSVDHVVSLAGLHHEPDVSAVFVEIRRLLRRGGLAVIADVAEGTAPARFLNGFVDRMNPIGHEGRFLDGGTIESLEAAGLTVIDDRVLATPWQFFEPSEASAFARRLFGTDRASFSEVADALANEIGFVSEPPRLLLNWSLRRIVCEAV